MNANDVSAYAASVSAITAIILAWMTGKYVRLTGRMVAEMKAARQPIVFVDLEIHDLSEVVLLIGNSGEAPARHCRFEVEDHIPWHGKPQKTPGQLPALKDGIAYLAPARTLRFRLGHVDWNKATAKAGWLNVTIHFEGEEDRKYVHRANIDLSRYAGLSPDTFTRPDNEVVSTLKEILQLGQQVANRTDPTRGLHRWCTACAHAIPYGAKKCAECGEWQPGSGPSQNEPGDVSPAS